MAEIRDFVRPKHLYRYRSLESEAHLERELSAIKQNYLWCSKFESLNDPMEGAYEASLWLQINERYSRIKEHIYNQKIALGICSFSEVNSHELMWAHYADQFRGICIEYRVNDLLEVLDDNIDLVRLVYNENAYRISLNTETDTVVAKKILSNKNHRWLYEREWRILCPKAGRLSLGDNECISCVYIGNRIDPLSKERILELLLKNEIPYKILEIDGYSISFKKPGKKKWIKLKRQNE